MPVMLSAARRAAVTASWSSDDGRREGPEAALSEAVSTPSAAMLLTSNPPLDRRMPDHRSRMIV
jgi:hypothetical protein